MMDWETSAPLTSLTHLDGRNSRKLALLRPVFSEFAWMKSRLGIMISYTQSIAARMRSGIGKGERKKLHDLVNTFSLSDAKTITTIEARVNHDIRAIELYLIEKCKRVGLSRFVPYVNLGIGSEDINSIALATQLVRSRGEVLVPALRRVIDALCILALREKDIPMVARTHGQPANMTTLGKELANPLSRLCDELEHFRTVRLEAKCSGEAGSFQAFTGITKTIDWMAFTDTFVRSFGLHPSHASTQITPYDSLVRYLQSLFRINTILIDCCKNMWLYVLLRYLKVKKVEQEVGSAGMPHKVNPIYFEGAEGGLEMANGIIETFVRKLPVNRLQRDFSDSTMRRNLVLPIAYSFLSYQSISQAFDRIDVDRDAIARDGAEHAEAWTETIKTYGTAHGVVDMYERLKERTRGKILAQADLTNIIAGLSLKEKERQELHILCDGLHNPYPGRIVEEVVARAKKL